MKAHLMARLREMSICGCFLKPSLISLVDSLPLALSSNASNIVRSLKPAKSPCDSTKNNA